MVLCKCSVCGVEFYARRMSARYCSPACKQKQYRLLHGQPMTVEEARHMLEAKSTRCTCVGCGRGFWRAAKGRKPKFCCPSCRQTFMTAKRRALIRWYVVHVENAQLPERLSAEWYASVEKSAREGGWRYIHAQRSMSQMQLLFKWSEGEGI